MKTKKPVEKAVASKPKTTPVKKVIKPKTKTKAVVAKPVTVTEVMQVQESVAPPWLDDKPKPIQAPKVMGVSEFLKAAGIRV